MFFADRKAAQVCLLFGSVQLLKNDDMYSFYEAYDRFTRVTDLKRIWTNIHLIGNEKTQKL